MLVHHPYESFATSFEAFVTHAANDPQVIAIKTTVYRTSDDSPLVPALIEAAERGTQTVCLVELKARFDERRNIEWAQALEQAGVHVVYGFPHLKIHVKATLVVRREGNRLRRYVHIGTGNYNSVTARTYEDVGLFTADEDIAADVADLFNYLTGFGRPRRFRKLFVAPLALRTRLIEQIRRVADAGDGGRIRLKVNALSDPAIIEELYRASQAGVRIDVIARSICMLRPGVEGVSENIRVRSVLGRFLEHSRVFAFEAADERVLHRQRGPDAAQPRPSHRDRRADRARPCPSRRSTRSSTCSSPTTPRRGSCTPDGTWARLKPKKSQRPQAAQAALMRRARIRSRRQAHTAIGVAADSWDDRLRPIHPPRSTPMRVGVVDIGLNTARLLVAEPSGDGLRTVRKGRPT